MEQLHSTDSFPARLRSLRKKNDWSQGQLAQKINIEEQRISKYERGLSAPSLDILVDIAHAFGVSLDYLLTGKGKSYSADNVKNPQLIEKIEEVDELPGEYQQTLISVLDSFVKRYKLEMLANS